MVEAWTRDGYYVQTSADLATATRIAREVAGREPNEVHSYSSDCRVGFWAIDTEASLLVPISFTCRAVLDFPTRQSARAVTWALRRRFHHARWRYLRPHKYWLN